MALLARQKDSVRLNSALCTECKHVDTDWVMSYHSAGMMVAGNTSPTRVGVTVWCLGCLVRLGKPFHVLHRFNRHTSSSIPHKKSDR